MLDRAKLKGSLEKQVLVTGPDRAEDSPVGFTGVEQRADPVVVEVAEAEPDPLDQVADSAGWLCPLDSAPGPTLSRGWQELLGARPDAKRQPLGGEGRADRTWRVRVTGRVARGLQKFVELAEYANSWPPRLQIGDHVRTAVPRQFHRVCW